MVHVNGGYDYDFVEYDGGAANNIVSASAVLNAQVFNVYDEGDTVRTLPEPRPNPSTGLTEYPCQLIDAHHGRCVIPYQDAVVDRVLSVPATFSTWPIERMVGPGMLAVGLGEGTNSFAAITNSDPYSASVVGGSGDDRIWLPKGPWSFATVGGGKNYIRAATNSAPIQTELDNGLYGYNGPDEIFALNGSYNDVLCGDDIDKVVADKIDRVASDCEDVTRR